MKNTKANTTKYLCTTPEGYRNWNQIITREWMSELTHTEFKCVMFIFDRTAGWKKQWERIPHNHFVTGIIDKHGKSWGNGTGIGKRTAIKCLASLVKKNMVLRKESGYGVFKYSLNYEWKNPNANVPKVLNETAQNLHEAGQEEGDY